MKSGPNPHSSDALAHLFHPPERPLSGGAWLWWFWLFFIHDENTKKTGQCRQIMILWSVKNDRQISCNGLDMKFKNHPVSKDGPAFSLEGAAAAWYFDGKTMHEDFVLHRSKMTLDPNTHRLLAPNGPNRLGRSAGCSSSFQKKGEDFITKIQTSSHQFELSARQTDHHAVVGPTHGRTSFGGALEIEGTRIERMELRGWEKGVQTGGHRRPISGTAYFQKILLAAPPPAWYWGLYHFADGSFATYMQVYAGRASMADNLWKHRLLRKPRISLKEDILIYHAASGRVFEGNRLKVTPSLLDTPDCWRHDFSGGGHHFTVEGQADAYAHACWSFQKSIGPLPLRSTFRYNEYPSVLRTLTIRPEKGAPMVLKNGVGNMENSWGFLV